METKYNFENEIRDKQSRVPDKNHHIFTFLTKYFFIIN